MVVVVRGLAMVNVVVSVVVGVVAGGVYGGVCSWLTTAIPTQQCLMRLRGAGRRERGHTHHTQSTPAYLDV